MGRHSAPDEEERQPDEPEGGAVATYVGSHSSPDPPLVGGTRADLALLRANARVRWSCIGAVLAAFAIYTVVMIVIGRADVYLLWVWAPIVLSGVLVGVVLDLAHRGRDADATRVTEQPDP